MLIIKQKPITSIVGQHNCLGHPGAKNCKLKPIFSNYISFKHRRCEMSPSMFIVFIVFFFASWSTAGAQSWSAMGVPALDVNALTIYPAQTGNVIAGGWGIPSYVLRWNGSNWESIGLVGGDNSQRYIF